MFQAMLLIQEDFSQRIAAEVKVGPEGTLLAVVVVGVVHLQPLGICRYT
jgi:hypothetical protein